jgi:hypothetical protein
VLTTGHAPSKEDVLKYILEGIPDNDIKLQVMYVATSRMGLSTVTLGHAMGAVVKGISLLHLVPR